MNYKRENEIENKNADLYMIEGSIYDYHIALGLSSLTTVALLLLILIIFFQIKFIISNETTSESIRRPTHIKNIYDKGCNENYKEFFTNINGYKNEVVYNESAIMFLKNSVLIIDHFKMMKTRGSVKDISKNKSVCTDNTSTLTIEMNISRVTVNSNMTTKNISEEDTDNI